MFICKMQAMSAVSKAAGVLHVCDSTMATPLMVKPLQLGADMTLQASLKIPNES